MKILIVDDQKENLYLLESLLKGSGYQVVSAENGIEALEKLKKDSVDMIISDILMPKMDGFQLCRKCKSDNTLRKIPFVFYTATYTDKKDEDFALSLGAEKFILKPLEPAPFMEIIKGILEDYKKGLLTPSKIPVAKEEVPYLKEYNERLIRKLEHKMLQLEQSNKDLVERVKELKCLYTISKLVEKPGISLKEMLQGIVNLIPSGWQYPEITCARLIHNGQEYITRNFRETSWKQTQDILVPGQQKDTLEVYYLEEKPARDEGPFLQEERILLNIIAERLGKIIERKRTEEQLRYTVQTWSATFNSIVDMVSIHDKDYKLIRANKSFADVFKKKPEELIGKTCYELIHGTKRPPSICPQQETLATKKPAKRELFEPRLGIHLEISTSPVFNNQGKMFGVVHIAKDISERKRLEKEKDKIQVQFLQAQKMEAVGTLAGGVAHDFNNLLTVIEGYTELLLDEIPATDQKHGDLIEIKNAADRASVLTNQLLIFSRKQAFQPKVLDLNTLIADMEKMLRRLIGEDVNLVTALKPELGHVKTDRGQTEQVIMNLVINARDAMPKGGKLIIKTETVTLSEDQCKFIPKARPGKFVRLSVEDSGSGMDKETMQHIFEPFFTTKEVGKGTGLGLSVVYGIIEQHQGWVNVYSEPGQGTTFKVYLPVFSEKTEDETKEVTDSSKIQGRGKRVLLVEDDEKVRKFAKRVLSKNGYVVSEAPNAEEALKVFEKEKGNFHILFSDTIMPGKNGVELAGEILSRKPEVRVLLTSGYSDDKSQFNLIREKGLGFLQKPYNSNDVLQSVKEAIESRR